MIFHLKFSTVVPFRSAKVSMKYRREMVYRERGKKGSEREKRENGLIGEKEEEREREGETKGLRPRLTTTLLKALPRFRAIP